MRAMGVTEAVWSVGRITDAGGIIHLEKDNSYMQFGECWTPVIRRGRRFAVKAKRMIPSLVVAPVREEGDEQAEEEAPRPPLLGDVEMEERAGGVPVPEEQVPGPEQDGPVTEGLGRLD